MNKKWKIAIGVGVALVAFGVFGYWYYFVRDDAPSRAALVTRETVEPREGVEGSWTSSDREGSFSGFRIQEVLAGGLGKHTAVVRTPHTTGKVTIEGNAVTSASVSADLTQLASTDSLPPGVPDIANRVGRLQNDGLEISRFPNATFEISEPIQLATTPKVGEVVKLTAKGNLTIHGVTKTVTIPINARWNGAVLDASGSLPVKLADYAIVAPSASFLDVTDDGTLEFELVFAPSR